MNELEDSFLFALTTDNELLQIMVSHKAQNEIQKIFSEAAKTFITPEDTEKEFSKGFSYTALTGEYNVIKNFKDPYNLSHAIKFPNAIKELNPYDADADFSFKALLTGFFANDKTTIYFQNYDRAQILKRKNKVIGILSSEDKRTFELLDNVCFFIKDNISAILDGSDLKFKSFNNVKRIFDNLKDYLREAEKPEIESFSKHKVISADADFLYNLKNSEINKLIFSIKISKVLDTIPKKTIIEIAQNAPIDIEISKNKKIIIPNDKKKAKEVLKFLNQDIFKSPLTDEWMETNSKRTINPSYQKQ